MDPNSPTLPAEFQPMSMTGDVDHIGSRGIARNGANGFNTQFFWYRL